MPNCFGDIFDDEFKSMLDKLIECIFRIVIMINFIREQ